MICLYTGKTKNLGVIGFPIHHSLSPVIQNAALQSMGLDYAYIALPVAQSDLENAVKGLKALNFSGFNVTIPHKIKIMQYLDEIDDAAEIIGAVNTIVNKNGRLIGYNTDYEGFLCAFKAINFSLKNLHAIVLGAGGAARAVAYGLLKSGVKSLKIAARNLNKAEKFAFSFNTIGTVEAIDWNSPLFSQEISKAELLVNATPLGMTPDFDKMPPVDLKSLPPQSLVYDVIYTPAKTKLLLEAEKLKHPILNGEYMLAGQGAAALEKWTCQKADIDLMRIALQKALSK